jgi:peroxiredoxin
MKTTIQAFIFTIGCMIAVSVNAQNTFEITGEINQKYNNQRVSLSYTDKNAAKTDTATIRNGSFMLKGSVTSPTKAKIVVNGRGSGNAIADRIRTKNEQNFYLENTKFTVAGDSIENAVIKGGAVQNDYLALQSVTNVYKNEISKLQNAIAKDFAAGITSINPETTGKLNPLRKKIEEANIAFIASHPDSYVSVNLMYDMGGSLRALTFADSYEKLTKRMKDTPLAQLLKARLETAKKTSTGQKALDFVQNDVNGKPIALSSMRGKYVLLDFWASWCGPCRAENPFILKAYNRFKNKNFEVLGISMDGDKEAWLKAIKEDGMPWLQLSDLKAKDNVAARLYGVSAIPQNFLLNPEGIIIATNLRGEALEKKLAEILN